MPQGRAASGAELVDAGVPTESGSTGTSGADRLPVRDTVATAGATTAGAATAGAATAGAATAGAATAGSPDVPAPQEAAGSGPEAGGPAADPPAPPGMPRHPGFQALQEWEGYVLEIGETDFTARLLDITAGAKFEEEEAIVPRSQLSAHDDEQIRPGSIFRWIIGYEYPGDGARRVVSRFDFDWVPGVTKDDLRKARAWAASMAAYFREGVSDDAGRSQEAAPPGKARERNSRGRFADEAGPAGRRK